MRIIYRKLLSIIICFTLVFFSGCQSQKSSEAKKENIKDEIISKKNVKLSTPKLFTQKNNIPTKEELDRLFKYPSVSFEKLQKAFKESGRKVYLTKNDYNIIQKKRSYALKHIEQYLNRMFGKANPYVLKAFAEVPREYYHYYYGTNQSMIYSAYNIPAVPYPIGYGSALSDFLGQAMMTQIADPKPGEIALEIGTGSGFQISILSRIVKEAYSIEIIEPLGKAVSKIFKPINFNNVHTKVGDGFNGWPEVKGGFDIIMLTCVARYVPPPLLEQLKPGGRLIIPLGTPFRKNQTLYLYTKDKNGKVKSKSITGVYFIPMTGKILKS